jgi:hypothetical protein
MIIIMASHMKKIISSLLHLELELFFIRTINLHETTQNVKTTNVEIMDIDVKTIILE